MDELNSRQLLFIVIFTYDELGRALKNGHTFDNFVNNTLKFSLFKLNHITAKYACNYRFKLNCFSYCHIVDRYRRIAVVH